METYAIEWAGGFTALASKGPGGIRRKCWMLDWFIAYDSDGNVVDREGDAPAPAEGGH